MKHIKTPVHLTGWYDIADADGNCILRATTGTGYEEIAHEVIDAINAQDDKDAVIAELTDALGELLGSLVSGWPPLSYTDDKQIRLVASVRSIRRARAARMKAGATQEAL